MAPVTDGRHRSLRSDVRFGVDHPSRANPSRDGDAKPGVFLREDSPVAGGSIALVRIIRGDFVKAILARFTLAVSLLATLALTLGAGVKWDWWD
jgi:hypothetical protein